MNSSEIGEKIKKRTKDTAKHFKTKIIIPDEEKVQLSEFEKLKKYYRIPWFLLLDSILLICVLVMFFTYSHPRNTYFKNFSESAAGYFLPKGFVSNQESQDLYHQFHFHKIQDAYDDITNTVTKFDAITKDSTDTIQKINLGNNKTLPIFMKVNYYNDSMRNYLSGTKTGIISNQTNDIFIFNNKFERTGFIEGNTTSDSLIGFNGNNLREVFDKITYIEMEFFIQSFAYLDGETLCMEWEITKIYEKTSTFTASIINRYYNCRDQYSRSFSTVSIVFFIILGIVSFVVACVNLIGLIERLVLLIRIFRKGHWKFNNIFKYLHWWYFVSIVGCVCNIIGVFILYLAKSESSNVAGRTFSGIGCCITVCTIIRHYYYNKRLYFLVQILRFGLPKAMNVFVGSIPLFFAFSLAGCVWFGWIHGNFGDILSSLVTLMCLMHSDDLRNIFNRIFAIDWFTRILGRIYLYSFQFIVFTIILNIFLVVIQETYMDLLSKEKEKKRKEDERSEEEKIMKDLEMEDALTDSEKIKEINTIVVGIRKKIAEVQNGHLSQNQEEILKNISHCCSQLIHEQT